jgi:uncharacterized protein
MYRIGIFKEDFGMGIITKYLWMHKLDDKNTFLLNTLSGAIDVVDNKTKEKIMKLQDGCDTFEVNDNDLILLLKSRNYLFDGLEDEKMLFNKYKRVQDKISSMNGSSINFILCPTMACNLRCKYCFEAEDIRKTKQGMTEMQVENAFKHINEIINRRKPKKTSIKLFGGEPLLMPNYHIVEKILELARSIKVPVSIISNGTNIEPFKELLEKYADMINFQITLDGVKEIHDKRRVRADNSGTFDEIFENIAILLSMGIKTSIRINVDWENVDSLRELSVMFKEKGWDKNEKVYTYLTPVMDHSGGEASNLMKEAEFVRKVNELFPDVGREESPFKMLLVQLVGYMNYLLDEKIQGPKMWKMKNCEADSGKNIIFAPDGMVYTCLELTGDKDFSIGTYDSEFKLDEEKASMWFERDVTRISKCRECKLALVCGGGCPVAALKINGDIDCPVCNDVEGVLSAYIDNVKDAILSKC